MSHWDDIWAEFQQLSEVRRRGGLRAKDELHWLDLREALAQMPQPELPIEPVANDVVESFQPLELIAPEPIKDELTHDEEIWELPLMDEPADETPLELSTDDISMNESEAS